MYFKVLGLIGVLFLFGCSGKEEPITKSYYMAHKDERLEKIEACKKISPSERKGNCISASSAEAQLSIDIMLGEGYPQPN